MKNLKKQISLISPIGPICQVCQRNCLIKEERVGFCLARKNIGGKIKSLITQPAIVQIDPIEKKPFYHFKPGSLVATIGTFGCNFRCKQCLNYSCSWGDSATETLRTLALPTSHNPTCLAARRAHNSLLTHISPKLIAQQIVSSGYSGIAFSYNEPVIWYDLALSIAKEFKSLSPTLNPRRTTHNPFSSSFQNPFALFVTNGSWTKETIDALTLSPHTPPSLPDPQPTTHSHPLIDAANIDLKGFSEETYKKQGAFFGQIPKMAVYAQKKGMFIELTTLLIPSINDNPEELKKMTEWIAKNLGPDTPWHLSQFDPTLAPDKEFQKLPFTTVKELQKAAEIGKKEGLNHIYIWPARNAVPTAGCCSIAGRAPSSHYSWNDTFCPKCKKIVIRRNGWQVEEINISLPNLCKFCGYHLNLIL